MKVIHALIGLGTVFALSTAVLFAVTALLPKSKSGYVISFPSNLNQLKDLERFLKGYKEDHFGAVLLLFSLGYLYKQTFAIPGSVFMNILAGALFGVPKSIFLTCSLTAIGASCCFGLSKIFGRVILLHYFPKKLSQFQEKITKNSDGMFFFLLCLRLFPMSPNWFLNMSSPVLGVPWLYFFPSVLFGLLPYNFICCQTGCVLSEIISISDVMTKKMMLKLALLALLVALPGVLKKWWKSEKNK